MAWALLLGVGLLMVGRGLQGVLIGVRSESEGFGTAVSSLVLAIYYLGFLVGARVSVHFLGTVGHIRVFAALSSLTSTAAIVFAVSVNPVSWALLQFTVGLCVAGIAVTCESWLNDMATNATRGRLLSMYMLVSMTGMGLGQFLLNVADPNGVKLFILASVLISLALVPVTLSATRAPALAVAEPMPLRKLRRLVPLAVTVAGLGGIALGTLSGLGAFFAATQGLSVARITLFSAVPIIGAIVWQWPVGTLSDRVQRRYVVLVVAAAAAGTALAHLWIPVGSALSLVLMFVMGGGAFPLYSLGVAVMADNVSSAQLNNASATLVRVFGIGSVVGPTVTGLLMAATAPGAYFVALMCAFGLVATYVAYRILTYEALPAADQGRFVAWPVRASAMAANLLRRRSARTKSAPRPARRRRRLTRVG